MNLLFQLLFEWLWRNKRKWWNNFCNFRSDRMREISSVLQIKILLNLILSKFLNLATMTQYDKNTPIPVLFPKDSPKIL